MKKIWKYAILLVALSALLCMSAFAADGLTVNNFVTGAVEAVTDTEYFTATYTGDPNKQYLILMLAVDKVPESRPDQMPDPTESTILYVNQDAAGEDGVVTFETVYPMALEDSVIWLTGGNDPVALASIDVAEPEGVTVSGTAASWNSTDDAVYLLYADTVDDATIKAEWMAGTYNAAYTGTKGTIAAATVDGKAMQSQGFSFEGVADGSYKLAIFKPGKYVPKIVTVTVSGSDVDVGQQKLWLYGDVTYDGNVNAIDALQIQLKSVGSSSFFDVGTETDKTEKMAAANVSEPLLGDIIVNAIDALQIKLKSSGAASAFDEIK